MQIQTDPEICVGAGMCALTAPDMFDQSEEDGTVVLLRDDLPYEGAENDVREAVERCPSGALRLAD
ncbi:ferredoxin [Streptomyces daqingensis]|uniref:Ferredoxin n=1 Tax=Streptomyces daqingensis TaxID=1472640 RepID=A0ABQ2LT23_9ACTN|nr:(4Fe-4S)-binding protein [Streptomyces daqingensis]GGO42856.1 ferredoxin [Streptomyces daqingensis]